MKRINLAIIGMLCVGFLTLTSCHSKKALVVEEVSQDVNQMGVVPVTVEVAGKVNNQMQTQEKALVKAYAIYDIDEENGDTIVTVDLVPDLKNNKLQAIKLGLNGGALFKVNSADLGPKADSVLSILADNMKNFPETDAIIVGYTSHTGPQAFNQQLSEKRAQSVMKYLASKGVSNSRMQALGRGWNDPVASNATVEGRALNRRVEVYITVGKKMIQDAAK